jgi:hypothetical protein
MKCAIKKVINKRKLCSKKSSLKNNKLKIKKAKNVGGGDKKKKKVISPSKMYFTQDNEDAIIDYNKEIDQNKRNNIYNTKIKYSFEKLVENIFNRFKFSYFETEPIKVQNETVAHLVSNIHKYEKGKGKAFSYFSIIAKHYLIFLNNSNYKRFNQHVEIGENKEENTIQLQIEDNHYKEVENREFMDLMIAFWENNLGKIFSKQRDLDIANSIIELFRNSYRLESFNKKALYLCIREMTDCKTSQITKIINKMKVYQKQLIEKYLSNGYFDTVKNIKYNKLVIG